MPSHEHKHKRSSDCTSPEGRIVTAFFLNFGFSVLELAGGYLTNSTAILADALHDLGDSFSLLAAWLLSLLSRKTPTAMYSYGYHRISALGALLNGLVLVAGSVLILFKAVPRLVNPEQPDARGMMLFAVAGILVNGFAAWRMRGGKTMNERFVKWHLWEDVLGWCAVLAGSLVMMIWQAPVIDPLLSVLISVFVFWNVFKNFRDTMRLFLQAAPESVEIDKVIETIRKNEPCILAVHDVHVWSLDGETHVASMHLVLSGTIGMREAAVIKSNVKKRFFDEGINHLTIEIEWEGDVCDLKSTL